MVKLTSYQWNPSAPRYDYLDAAGDTLTSQALFRVTAVARGSGERVANNTPSAYQKLLVQGADGMYLNIDSAGALAATTSDQRLAGIFVLDLTRGTNAYLS